MAFRDEQIKLSTARIKARIEPCKELRTEPIALVGFGPSLNQTWEQIKDFKWIMSCSGAHRFLIDHGIVPTWHLDVDPRPHKVKLIGEPHKDVEYLISSTCHPALFDHLEGFNVKLWHVFANEKDAIRTLPPGEWAITGGCSAGLRTLTIARFIGFTDLHIFGMDGSCGPTGNFAGPHPNSPAPEKCEYEGVVYNTTVGYLEAAKQMFHELDQMPGVKATFYGEGLTQHMAKKYQPKPIPKEKAMIGFAKPELISSTYLDLNRQLHHENLAYGVGGGKHAPVVKQIVEKMPPIPSVLDYGCGKSYLAKALDFPIWEYDPAISGKEESPKPADLVVCTDVLEHIEPEKLAVVLNDLRRCVKHVGYFTINTAPAKKLLANGQNTHLLQHDEPWWTKILSQFFKIGKVVNMNPELRYLVGVKT